jgi:hypothetical protein
MNWDLDKQQLYNLFSSKVNISSKIAVELAKHATLVFMQLSAKE